MDNTFSMDSPELQHHGILGMKWGIRRYQNPDGSLTPLGRRRVQRAMKQHDTALASRDVHDRDREYKRFRDIVTKMYPSEVAELTMKVEQAERLRKLSEVATEDKIEKGLKYTESIVNIIGSTGKAVSNFASAAQTISNIKATNAKTSDSIKENELKRKEKEITIAKQTVSLAKDIKALGKDTKDIADKTKDVKEARKDYKEAKETEKEINEMSIDEMRRRTEARVAATGSKNLINEMKDQPLYLQQINAIRNTPVLNDPKLPKDSEAARRLLEDDDYLARLGIAKHSSLNGNNWVVIPSNSDLMHHGILGMKWGVRRYQNKDGSLTKAGRARYGQDGFRSVKQYQNRLNDLDTAASIINKRIETKQNVKDALIRSKAKADTYIDFDGGTIAERVKSKLLARGIKSLDDSINRNAVTREKGYQEMANIIQGLQDSGFKITTKPTTRNVNAGKDYIANLAAGPAAAASLGFLTLGIMPGGPVLAPVAAGLVSSAVLGTSVYSLINNRAKGTKFKVEEGG